MIKITIGKNISLKYLKFGFKKVILTKIQITTQIKGKKTNPSTEK
jgi:hypothetical protein